VAYATAGFIGNRIRGGKIAVAGEFREILAKRQAELAILQPIVVMNYAGIDLVGPLPVELQPTAAFAFLAGIGDDAKEPFPAKALIQ
jgi:hypothetical protein